MLNGKCSRDVWIHGHRNTPSFDRPGFSRGIVRDKEECRLLFMISRRPMAESHRANLFAALDAEAGEEEVECHL